MKPRHDNSVALESAGRISAHYEAAGRASAQIGLVQLTALLDECERRGLSFVEAKARWVEEQRKSVVSKRSMLLGYQLSPWLYLRNPAWALVFEITRAFARLKTPGELGIQRLDGMLGRAQFSHRLSKSSMHFLRENIRDGHLTQSEALSIVRTIGCKISKSGDICPNPIGKTGLVVGETVCVLLVTIFIFLSFFLGSQLGAESLSESKTQELLFMMWTSVMCAVLTLSLSWERQRMATRVCQLIELTCYEHDCPA